MNMPVFDHTLRSLHAIINNEKEPLNKISVLIKYDPGLSFSLIQAICSASKHKEVSTISQAISLLGSEGVERHILTQDTIIGEEYILLWCYAVLAGEMAVAINARVGIADEDEAFFAGILPVIGMLFMIGDLPNYGKVFELLLKIPIEDKMFIEDRLYGKTLIDQLKKSLFCPKIFSDIVDIMGAVYSRDGLKPRGQEQPSRLSAAYDSYRLFNLMDTAGAAARSILFPVVVEAQEKFRELSKRYFKVAESEIEEMMADVIERFDEICRTFGVEHLSSGIIAEASEVQVTGIHFLTESGSIKQSLASLSDAVREERNICLWGEPGTGKRLLAAALYYLAENPRKAKPFISIHCATLDSETMEMELFGTKGGFLGLPKHKGALEMADGGTLLLKDIDMMPLTLQDKLAEVFCKDEYYRIGDTQAYSFDIRFIITSLKDIPGEAKAGRFSARLLNALKPASMYIPPLRERREDIDFIADSIINKYRLNLTDSALRLGMREYYETHPFPNNLRDLKKLLFYFSAKHSLKS